jgi:ATP-dependent RNA helicase MSS116, mitochondrial
VAQAKTGTGKTLAFLIPMMQRMILEDPRLAHTSESRIARANDIRGLILSPTRELAEQIAKEAMTLAKGTGLVVQLAVGGTRKDEMLRQTRARGCHLMVGTPGRVRDLLEDPRSGIDCPSLTTLVLDEADRMLDVGFADELKAIIDMLPDERTKTRQTMLFSATIPGSVVELTRKMVRPDQFQFVQTIQKDEVPTHHKVPQHIVPVNSHFNTLPTLMELIHRGVEDAAAKPDGMPFKAIVFCPTTTLTQLSGGIYRSVSRSAGIRTQFYVIHSKLSQARRTNVAQSFRTAKSAILFSSDVTARGLDFPNVSHVIQLGAPPDREQYIHRLGRTGRQDKDGEGWLIADAGAMSECRNLLGGLPLKVVNSLESAQYQGPSISENAPKFVSEVGKAYQHQDPADLTAAYLGLLGRISGDKYKTLAGLSDWAQDGWGWDQPPYISPGLARKRGLQGLPGVNTTVNNLPASRESSDNPFAGDSFSSRSRDGRDGRDNRDDRRRRDFGDATRGDGGNPFERGSMRGRDRFGGRQGGNRDGHRRRGGDWGNNSRENHGDASF